MNRERNSRDEYVVFHQDRRKLVGMGLIGVVFVVLGIAFIAHPEVWKTTRHSADSVESAGWLVTTFFSMCSIAVAVSLVRPTKIKLGLKGIVVTTPWRTYSRPWDAVSDFKIWEYRRNRTVVFNDATPPNPGLAEINRRLTGATSAMPPALNVGPDQLLAVIEEVRQRSQNIGRDAAGFR
jgi:hypothetical protein